MANQAWQITSPSTITLADLNTSIPKPGPKQVLVRIHAISFNFRDILVVDHSPHYLGPAKPDLIPCSDGAGMVEEAGEGSTWKKGDRVVICPNGWIHGTDQRDFNIEAVLGSKNLDGALRRWMVLDDDWLVSIPPTLTFEEAASIHTAGVTSFRALFHGPMEIRAGTTVLTQGTGGVSCFAIQARPTFLLQRTSNADCDQFAAAVGATVIATSSSDDKLEIAKKLGAKHVINYSKTPNWGAEVLKITNGTGVDFVLENIGAEGIKQSLEATRFAGAIVSVGVLSENPQMPVDIMLGILYGAKILKGHLGAGSKDVLAETVAFMEKYDIHPQLAKIWAFEDADKGLEDTRKLSAPGKVVVKV